MKVKPILISALVGISLLTFGCAKTASAPDQNTKTIQYEGTSYTVPKSPERIAVLSNSLLSMIYALDGKAISRPMATEKLPPDQEAVPTIGHTNEINTEALLSLKPDVVLGLKTQHEKLSSLLTSDKVPHMIISYDGITDNVPLLEALGQLLNKEAKSKEVIATYEGNLNKVKDAIKSVPPARVAVLRATGSSVTAETENAIGASMVHFLGMTDVVASHIQDATKSSKTVPYSLETLAIDNPDIIFIVTMGKQKDIDDKMKQAMTNNPAWSQLKAVQNNKVFYLPSNLFLLNPGLQTPNAIAQLVKYAYGIDVTL